MFLLESTVKAIYVTFSVVSAEAASAVIHVYVCVCLSLRRDTTEIQVRTVEPILLLRSHQVLLLLVLMKVVFAYKC